MVLVIAAYWKKVDKNSAFWSMLIGGIVAAVWHFAGQPFGIVPFWPGCGTGLVILVVMTALNGKKVSDDYARYKALMDARPRKRAVKPHRSIIRPAGPRPGRRLMTRGIKNVSI